MRQRKYDVFISYRREGGYETALPIVEKLRSAGYRVFFDLESMNSGKFNEQLYAVIDSCKDFILVLPPNGLDRCSDPSDWVRKEIECALTKHKNIIPVLLKGFSWPEHTIKGLEELPNYQGVSASNPEHFDASIQRLKGYLKSRPQKPIKKWATITGLILCLLILACLIASVALKQMAAPVCKEAGSRLTLTMDALHNMYSINDKFYSEWELYIEQRQISSEQSKTRLDYDFKENINKNFIPNIEQVIASFPTFKSLSNYEKFLLGLYDIDPADLEHLNFLIKEEGDGIIEGMQLIQYCIENNHTNLHTISLVKKEREYFQHGTNSSYYTYLSELSKMPSPAWDAHKTISTKWHLYPNISESLSSEEYIHLHQKEMKTLDKYTASQETLTQLKENTLNREEEKLSDLEIQYEQQSLVKKQSDIILDPIEEKKKSIAAKQEEVDNLRDELSKKIKQIRATFESLKEKFAIDGSEDQYIKWGKICRSASFLEKTLETNRRGKGIYVSPVSPNEILDFMNQQLDSYKRYHPETAPYVDAAKAFYKDVASGNRNCSGLLVMGFQDDKPHPLLQIGDIVVDRNNYKDITNIKAYSAAEKQEEPGTISWLQLKNGTLKEMHSDYINTDVRIGFLQLKD